MKIFIDTANVVEIQNAWDMGFIAGVTTNPTLIAREGVKLETRIKEILQIVKEGPVNAESIGKTAQELIDNAHQLTAIDPRVVVKIPMCAEGLKAIKVLHKEGIKTNATLIFTANQGLLAARSGANYISPFLGRLDDIGHSSQLLLDELAKIWQLHKIKTEIIAASIRSVQQATIAACYGCHIATIPYKVLKSMIEHPLTDIGIKRFEADWQQAQKKSK